MLISFSAHFFLSLSFHSFITAPIREYSWKNEKIFQQIKINDQVGSSRGINILCVCDDVTIFSSNEKYFPSSTIELVDRVRWDANFCYQHEMEFYSHRPSRKDKTRWKKKWQQHSYAIFSHFIFHAFVVHSFVRLCWEHGSTSWIISFSCSCQFDKITTKCHENVYEMF